MADASSDEELQAPLQKEVTGATGMPEGVTFKPGKSATILGVLFVVPFVIGAGIAYAINHFGDTAAFAAKITVMREVGKLNDVYFAVVVMAALSAWLNSCPMYFKDKVMTGASGNLRANMTISKVNVQNGAAKLPYVVLEEEGEIGEYNRANRSMLHFVENLGAVLLAIPFAGFVFPRPTLILVCVFALGRVLHQLGYVRGYGKHAPGFMLTMIAEKTLVGLVLMAAVLPGTAPAASA